MLHETGAARQRNIPDYDYLLQEREVSKLAEVVMKQIREREIEGFMFFIEPVANDPMFNVTSMRWQTLVRGYRFRCAWWSSNELCMGL